MLFSSSDFYSGHWSERGAYGMFPHWDSILHFLDSVVLFFDLFSFSSSSVPNSGHWSERGAYGMFPHWDSLIASLIHWEHNFTNQFPSTFDQNRMDTEMYIFLCIHIFLDALASLELVLSLTPSPFFGIAINEIVNLLINI